MNNKAKARLRRVVPELAQVQDTLTELEVLRDLELAAAERHANKGAEDFAKHAAWSAAGITRALAYIRDLNTVDATEILYRIDQSRPTDDLPAWTGPEEVDTTTVCGQGSCNHPEHL